MQIERHQEHPRGDESQRHGHALIPSRREYGDHRGADEELHLRGDQLVRQQVAAAQRGREEELHFGWREGEDRRARFEEPPARHE